MSIENWSDNVILVNLAKQPEAEDELLDVTELAQSKGNCDVVIDCSGVEILTVFSRSKLMNLRNSLASLGHRLVLCNPSEKAKEVLNSSGLTNTFRITNDKCSALTCIQMAD